MEDRESKVQSLDEYLGERGLSFPVSDFMLDKTRIPHGLTSRAEKRMHREADIARNDYSKRIETSLKTAHGHEDNPSVQAARRMLKKRGIDWKTGKKLKTLEDDSAK